MARRRARKRERSYLANFLAISFFLGLLLGAVLVSTWMSEPPALQLAEGENYVRSITIVGIEKSTGEGMLATLKVGLIAGQGRLLINVPPWENEDTQRSFLDARNAAEHWSILEMGLSLEQIDIIVSLENLSEETTIAGPSASAAMSIALVAMIRASKNIEPNQVRQDAVVSASINSTGVLMPVGGIKTKYEKVRAGGFSLFIVASTQGGGLPNYPDIQVERVRNLHELVTREDLILIGS
ncbi:MAG: S16 family serine protease [Candidatus Hadarchaeaceae archaeon]